MKAVIQRVSEAQVTIADEVVGSIETGLLVLVGFEAADDQSDIDWVLNKVINMRIFPDDNGKMNASLLDVEGGLLSVSQFTLHAKTKKGNRPSFINSAHPEIAEELYNYWCTQARLKVENTSTGRFGANMLIGLVNDGPVTITIDSKNRE